LVALGLVLLGRPLIEYVYTASFLPAYEGLLIMLVGIVYGNSLYWSRSALLSLGLADHATRVNFLVTILSVTGLILLLPVYGFIGSALILSFGSLLGNSLVILRVRSELRKQEALFPTPLEDSS
jgi:O-antigen/teichoic acid export membrane protein